MSPTAEPKAANVTVSQVEHAADDRDGPPRFESPLRQGRAKILWPHVIVVAGVHLLATLAVLPWLFSWTGVALLVLGVYLFGTFGINIGYHRLLSHRSFKSPPWFERTLALLGVCSLQGTPCRWVALHRMHHQYSDQEQDPHTPLVTFLWAHFEWLLTEEKHCDWLSTYDKYAPDLARNRFFLSLDRHATWLWLYAAHAVAFFAGGFAAGWLLPGGSAPAGLQLGASLLVWGVFARTVVVWHITWSVNSLTHFAGYRNYDTSDQSRNNWLVGLMAAGEGWHNNHHADPRSAAAGHRWWEFDLSFLFIRALGAVGLASEIVPVRVRAAGDSHHPQPVMAVVHRHGRREAVETAGEQAGPHDSVPAAPPRQRRSA